SVQQTRRLLTVNVGSSSLKAVLYRLGTTETVEARAAAERIGLPTSHLQVADAQGRALYERSGDLSDHPAALASLCSWLRDQNLDDGLIAIGQRIVQGGRHYSAPTLITDTLLAVLRSLMPLDTEHLPQALQVIACLRHAYPNVPQVASFDTA